VLSQKRDPSLQVQLLEYDMRFERYGKEFTFYDYNEPEDLPLQLKHCFHIIVADPPYLVKFLQVLNFSDAVLSWEFWKSFSCPLIDRFRD